MTATAEQKWAGLAAWKTSGKSQRDFAPDERFSLSTFRWWSSRIRTKKARKVAEITPKISMARVIRIPPIRESDAVLVVELGVGARVIVRRGFDGELLRDVVSALAGAR